MGVNCNSMPKSSPGRHAWLHRAWHVESLACGWFRPGDLARGDGNGLPEVAGAARRPHHLVVSRPGMAADMGRPRAAFEGRWAHFKHPRRILLVD
jgi:hypothetical protein